MKLFDRILLLVLVAGIWTLVFSPLSLQARSETNCAFTFDTATGQLANGHIVIVPRTNYGEDNRASDEVRLKNRSITLDKATGSVTCP